MLVMTNIVKTISLSSPQTSSPCDFSYYSKPIKSRRGAMNRQGDWDVWNQRLSVIWADSVHGARIVGEMGESPQLKVDGISLPLGPSHWGLGEEKSDVAFVEKALESLVQGHAPDYWRNSNDPLVQALGWFDRRIGKRSWRQHDDQHGPVGRSSLERQVRAIRDHADAKQEVVPLNGKSKRSP